MPPNERTGARSRVVVAGAGVAGLEVALGLRELVGPRVMLHLVEPRARFSYRPLAIAAALGLGSVYRLDVATIAAELDAELHVDVLAAVEPHTHGAILGSGRLLEYDALVVAAGGRPQATLPGALTFGGEQDAPRIQGLLGEIAAGTVRTLAFVVPGGIAWPFALYELAILTAQRVADADVTISLVSSEAAPLAHFGADASASVAQLLDQRGIRFVGESYPVRIEGRRLVLAPSGSLDADRVVALARVRPPDVAGLPLDRDGFLPTGPSGHVLGVEDIYAAGDVTSFPLKQGGLAVQEARAVAETLAAELGADVTPEPFRPVLRGRLLTGNGPQYLRAVASGGAGDTSVAAESPLWWPPAKIAGGRLAAFLAQHGLPVPIGSGAGASAHV